MNVISIARPIESSKKWDGGYEVREKQPGALRETILEYPKHGFTHVDAPRHMIHTGNALEMCPIEQLCGASAIIDISDHVPERQISGATLEERGKHLREGDIAILRSNLPSAFDADDLRYTTQAPWLDDSACEWLVRKKCRSVVVDFPQDYVAREMSQRRVENMEFTEHQIVLGAGLMHLEHVWNLDAIIGARGYLLGLPLRLAGDADGGPAGPIFLHGAEEGTKSVWDLSMPVYETPDGMVRVRKTLSFEAGDPVQETGVWYDAPRQTHVVAPSLVDGKAEAIGEVLARPAAARAVIADLGQADDNAEISLEVLKHSLPAPKGAETLLLRTGFSGRAEPDSADWYRMSPYLSDAAAKWIVEQGFRQVGSDFELDRGRKELRGEAPRIDSLFAERILLGSGVSLIKNLINLSAITKDHVFLAPLALNLPKATSAPARVIAIDC